MARRKKTTRRTPSKARKTSKTHKTQAHKIAHNGHLGDWLAKLPTQDWFDFASQQRTRLVREINHLSTEILHRIGEANILSNRDEIVKEAKDHLDSIITRINRSELISRVIKAARGTRNEILTFLNIPSPKELSALQKRLNQLEKKMTSARGRSRTHA